MSVVVRTGHERPSHRQEADTVVLDDTQTLAATHDLDAPDLDATVADIARLGRYRQMPADEGRHLAGALTHRLILGLVEHHRAGRPRDDLAMRLRPAWEVHSESPFIRRLQSWPRGYPGDFETIEYILAQANGAEPGRLSYWLEQHALDSPIAQQHRNKVDLQARAILEAVVASAGGGPEPRILVLAAGGSPDLRQIAGVLSTQRFRAVLLDQDEAALRFGAERLSGLGDRLTIVRRNAVRALHEIQGHGPFHLVLAGGLFDYLPDRVAALVLRHAREHLLAEEGRIVFTNIAARNPFRAWIEHLADWRLIHRSERDLRRLCVDAGFDEGTVTVSFERTGLAAIVTCRGALV
jgi:hypothetical protein